VLLNASAIEKRGSFGCYRIKSQFTQTDGTAPGLKLKPGTFAVAQLQFRIEQFPCFGSGNPFITGVWRLCGSGSFDFGCETFFPQSFSKSVKPATVFPTAAKYGLGLFDHRTAPHNGQARRLIGSAPRSGAVDWRPSFDFRARCCVGLSPRGLPPGFPSRFATPNSLAHYPPRRGSPPISP